mgnify:CR=1 FL=1
MTEGRLFRSAAANGPMAEQAEVALDRPRATADTDGSREAGAALNEAALIEDSANAPTAGSVIPAVVPPIVEPPADFEHLFSTAAQVDNAQEAARVGGAGASIAANEQPADALDAFDHLFTEESTPPANEEPAIVAAAVKSDPQPVAEPEVSSPPPVTGLATLRAMRATSGGPNPRMLLPLRGVATLIIGSTVLVGLLEALLFKRIGILTGIVSVLVTLACSFRANPDDRSAAMYALPAAWLVCALLPGQLVAPSAGSWMFRQVVLVLQVLGDNAWWILIGTAAAFAISLVERRRASTVV